jgi:biopolymer transport protein TolQ
LETTQTDFVKLIADATPLAQAVMGLLVIFSAISWGVIASKFAQFRRASAQTAAFLDVFRRSSRFSEVQSVCGNLTASPLVGLFQAGYAEVNAQLRHTTPAAPAADPTKPSTGTPRPTLKSMDALDRALLRAAGVEVTRLEKRVGFLATTASITPYIGLFGTVIGIMNSFMGIAGAGSSSLGVVAPGIAEALIATALGLFAAIPAVYFYNELTSKVKAFTVTMDDFAMEFLNIAERNFT